MEEKQKILDLLLPALQSTSGLRDLVSLEYINVIGEVKAVYEDGRVDVINVAGDSGLAMVNDVLQAITRY